MNIYEMIMQREGTVREECKTSPEKDCINRDLYLTETEFHEIINAKNENRNVEAIFRKFTKEIRQYLQ